jgi:hypothetical protein
VRSVRILGVVVAVGVVILLGGAGAQPLSAPFFFQEPGQPPLLVLRCVALVVALVALRRRLPLALGVVALFYISLVVRGFAWPLFAVLLACAAQRRVPRASHRVLALGLVAAVALAALPLAKAPPSEPPASRNPAAMVAYWRGRHNLWHARWWALQWTPRERDDPGEAFFALATIDWELGRHTQARKVIDKIVERSTSDSIRARAMAQRSAWSAEP